MRCIFSAFSRHNEDNSIKRIAWFEKRCRINSRSAEAWANLGNIQRDDGQLAKALTSYDKALQLKPDYSNGLNGRGVTLLRLNQASAALACFDKALAVEPTLSQTHYNRGVALRRMERLEHALESFERAIASDRLNVDAYVDRATTLMQAGRTEEALAAFEAALTIAPGLVSTHYNRAVALLHVGRLDEALVGFNETLKAAPDHLGALNNRGVILLTLNCPDEALASFDRALAIAKNNPETLNNRGTALENLKRFNEALASYDRAIANASRQPDAFYKRGVLLEKLNRMGAAVGDYRHVLSLDPNYKYALGRLVHTKMRACDWTGLEDDIERLRCAVNERRLACDPSTMLTISPDLPEQLACARLFVSDKYPPAKAPLWDGACYQHERIRLAYVCGEFSEHATSYLAAELFELHDKSRFETFAISTTQTDHSAMRARVEAAFDMFVEGATKSDLELAELMRRHEIEIAVNLNGYYGIERTGVFALRPCPIQVNYLGFAGTMGAEYMDYLIADSRVISPDEHSFYSEKIVYLPDTYQVNDSKKPIAEGTWQRSEAGLPDAGFVFCCFNNNHKITAEVFAIWCRLLRQLDGSVLWLLEGNLDAKHHLQREAQTRGIAPERLVFAPRVGLPEHLARHRLADLFLDTLPYNAHTTASDALWSGTPVLTCLGSTFSGRVAASLLDAIELPEMICRSMEEYEALALRIARDPSLLGRLKTKLAGNRRTCALFDTDRFRRHIEATYITMSQRYRQGQCAESFSIGSP